MAVSAAEIIIVILVLYTGLVIRSCYRMIFFPRPTEQSLQDYERLLEAVESLSRQNSELAGYVILLRSEVRELRRLVLQEEP